MQRIDENTYIDDTLVTCAEYQLFIDEMREQGKYYQPDHWTSYQFPKGKAREPILGVRHSDAVEFSRWLTQSEGAQLEYRLPTLQDANIYPVKTSKRNPLGYWSNQEKGFIWIGSSPKNTKAYNFIDDLQSESEIAINQSTFLSRNLESQFMVTNTHSDAVVSSLPVDSETTGVGSAMHYAKDLASSLLNDEYSSNTILLFVETIDKAYLHTNNIANFFNDLFEMYHEPRLSKHYDIDGGLQHLRVLQKRLIDSKKRANEISKLFERIKIINLAINRTLDLDYAINNNFYQSFSYLQERIAGGSPAFEGIRLVKERIK